MVDKNICLACWGTGLVPDFWDETKEVQCPRCHGTGKEPNKTNFQRITASPEVLAEFIVKLVDDCTIRHECGICHSWCDEKVVSSWLKQESE